MRDPTERLNGDKKDRDNKKRRDVDSDDDLDLEVKLEEAEASKDANAMLSPEDARRQGELAEGVQKIRVSEHSSTSSSAQEEAKTNESTTSSNANIRTTTLTPLPRPPPTVDLHPLTLPPPVLLLGKPSATPLPSSPISPSRIPRSLPLTLLPKSSVAHLKSNELAYQAQMTKTCANASVWASRASKLMSLGRLNKRPSNRVQEEETAEIMLRLWHKTDRQRCSGRFYRLLQHRGRCRKKSTRRRCRRRSCDLASPLLHPLYLRKSSRASRGHAKGVFDQHIRAWNLHSGNQGRDEQRDR